MQTELGYATGVASHPSDWSEAVLEAIAEINPESLKSNMPKAFQFRYIDISSVNSGVIDWDSVTTEVFASAPSRARRVARPGDVLLSTVRPGLQSHAFADWRESDGYVCSTGFAVLRAKQDFEPRFLHHLVFSETIATQLRRLETGSNYPAVPERDVRLLRIPVPPLVEQRRIAAILDTVDETLTHTDQVIAKLRQIKAGLLHDLLTCGLDEQGQLRDPVAHPEQFRESPLGRVPRKWTILRLGHLCDLLNGLAFKPEDWTEFGLPIIRIQNLNGSLDFNCFDKPVPEAYLVSSGTLLFSWSGNRGTSFGPYIWDGPLGVLNQHIFKVTPRAGIRTLWFYYALDDVRQRAERAAHGGSGLVHVRRGDLMRYLIAVPSGTEQDALEAVLATHDARIRAEEAYRDKLRLVKAGLMDDLLTGRVRVAV